MLHPLHRACRFMGYGSWQHRASACFLGTLAQALVCIIAEPRMVHMNGSVVLHGSNRHDDVVAIQKALLTVGHTPGAIDERCGRRTIAAIVAVQRSIIARPDGLVEVHGPMWRRLVPFARSASSSAPPRLAARSFNDVTNKRDGTGGTGRISGSSTAPRAIVSIVAAASGRLNYTDHLPLQRAER